MISVENIGGFRHADMFLITADGSELLTTFDNGLLVKSWCLCVGGSLAERTGNLVV